MFSKITSLGLFGLDGCIVTVEADTSGGLPAFDIVGLPDTAVSESRERVRLAIKNTGFKFPQSRITVNLAPADIKKTGSVYDLPIMLAILLSSNQLTANTSGAAFLGELSLDGTVRSVGGVLPMTIAARQNGADRIFVPKDNAAEAAIVEGIAVYGVESCDALVRHLLGKQLIEQTPPQVFVPGEAEYPYDFSDVKGQPAARRAMEIAAAGGHNVLLIGPAGTGKSMLAKRLPSILPPLSYSECIEVTKIYSVANQLGAGSPFITERPFRAPHHTVSSAGLAGGGTIPKPGELSKAHCGVLFLDEIAEFPRATLDVLRQPVEDGKITISRSSAALTYPCEIMLVAAMNPCPCGNFGNPKKPCTCTPFAISKYIGKISGPLVDRIDLHVEVHAVDYESMSSKAESESSAEIRKRVVAARVLQTARYSDDGINCNARLTPKLTGKYCTLTDGASQLLKRAFENLGLSARAHDKILRVARTIADLEGADQIDKSHISEAVSYRTLDKKYWNG